MDTKISKADGSGISTVTERESGIRLGTIRKAVERTPVMTNDRGYHYAIGHTSRTVWYGYTFSPGASTARLGTFSRQGDAVAAVVRMWTR